MPNSIGAARQGRKRGPKPRSPLDLFLSHVFFANGGDGCWIWTAYIHPTMGYGMWRYDLRTSTAHQWSIELFGVHKEPGWEIHHQCRNPRCVRPDPDHLVPMSEADHHARHIRDVCQKGLHPMTGHNVLRLPSRPGWRLCRACNRFYQQRRRAEKRTVALMRVVDGA